MAEWRADPVGRHQERLHDGTRWTDQVRDRGVVNTDASGLETVQAPVRSGPVESAAPLVPPSGPADRSSGTGGFGKVGAAPPPPPGPVGYESPMVPVVSSGAGAPPPAGAPVASYRSGAVPGQSNPLASMGSNAVVVGLLAGAVGGGLGTIVAEPFHDGGTATSETDLNFHAAIYIGIVGAAIGFTIAAWPAFTARAWNKAWRDGARGAAAGAGAGFVGGWVAQMLYTSMLKGGGSASLSALKNKLRLARVAAWALFGGALGLGLGIREGSRKIFNGLLGGGIGGAVGGLIFQEIDFSSSSAGMSTRLFGLVATGIGIGLGIGIVDRLRRDAWLRLSGGPLHGREVILFKDSTSFGADHTCDVVLANDPAVVDQHALFRRTGGNTTVLPVGPVAVNGETIVEARFLHPGDRVSVGATSISYEERAARL